MSFNITLFLIFVLYILSLGVGFKISKKRKDSHNKMYYRFKSLLYVLIIMIFSSSLILSYEIYKQVNFGIFVLGVNLCFVIYFLFLVWFNTRCWKQHRMLFYNFFTILIFYFGYLLFENPKVFVLFGLIYVYNVIEFSFAKFDIGFGKIWD